VLSVLQAGDHVVAMDDQYGGTYRLFTQVFERFGITFEFVDATSLDLVRRALERPARLIWLESPTNPLLRVVDLAALSEIAQAAGALVAVDNTFMSPYFQRPLELGADLVVHSATKYLGGHSDAVHGAVIGRDPGLGQQIAYHQNAIGAVPGPFDCWLILRGLKTLAVRMRQHETNARRIAEFLSSNPAVEKVNYPGLPDHPQHAIATQQMDGFGGMLSFTVRGGLPAARAVARATELFTLAESLGGVESLIELPAAMTHASIPPDIRQAIGIDDGLIRVSVGIEDPDDLLADLGRAIALSQA
jgi:cystathionine gamma-lyase